MSATFAGSAGAQSGMGGAGGAGGGLPNACAFGIETHWFTGETTQLGRIYRDGIPSECVTDPDGMGGAPPTTGKAYPGIFNEATTHNYEVFSYQNMSTDDACVTVNFDPNTGESPCGTHAHVSAYTDSYDPENQGENYIGDVGSSSTQPFSFTVPGGADVHLVVTNTAGAAICDFSFELVDLPCKDCGNGITELDEECDDGGETEECNLDCTLTACGDAVVNEAAGEECDDGGETEECNLDCTLTACGDAVVNEAAGEECDDGNTTSGDGCSSDCQSEQGGGTGGSTTGSGGDSSSSGGNATDDDPLDTLPGSSNSGCGCHLSPVNGAGVGIWAGLLLGAVARLRRRGKAA